MRGVEGVDQRRRGSSRRSRRPAPARAPPSTVRRSGCPPRASAASATRSMPSRASVVDRLALELGIDRGDGAEIDASSCITLVTMWSVRQSTASRPNADRLPGFGGTMQACMPSRSITAGDCAGPGAAERQQREAARIDAALDGHLADRVGLVPVGDLDDAVGELLGAHVAGQPRGERRDAGARRARHRARCRRRSAPAECGRARGWRR